MRAGFGSAPVPAEATHRLLLPAAATDGYHWILQTESMLADGTPVVRFTDADNAPRGREVHWSSAVRWQLAALAAVHRSVEPNLSWSSALERSAILLGPVTLAAFLLLLAPWSGLRLGGAAAAILVLGMVGTGPVYQAFSAGTVDHHALVLIAGMLAVLFPAVGALRTHEAPGRTLRIAFAAGGIAGGAGLWISAASQLPVLIGIALAGLLVTLRARSVRPQDTAPAAPWPWRWWAGAGCLTSLAFHAVEYFPSHLGLRLEVNHPVHALAWLAAGDALARLGRKPQPRLRAWLALDVLVLLLPLACVVLGGSAVFRPADPFLGALHAGFIAEFRSIGYHFSRFNAAHLLQGTAGLLPLAVLPAAALAWEAGAVGAARWLWRGTWTLALSAGLAFTHALAFPAAADLLRAAGLLPESRVAALILVHVLSAVADLAAFGLLFLLPRRRFGRGDGSSVAAAALALAFLPGALVLALTLRQVRWLGQANGLLLVGAAILAATLAQSDRLAPSRRRGLTAALLLACCLPFMSTSVRLGWRAGGYPVDRADLALLGARDVAAIVRARLGNETGVVLSAPTATSWLMYFGGLKGVGTLYWENIDGLKAAAAMYAAQSEEEAQAALAARGVTHIVVFSWEPFVSEYAALAALDAGSGTAAPAPGFLARILGGEPLPDWLVALPSAMPRPLQGERAWIFEVVRR